jgi:hypothetical protein
MLKLARPLFFLLAVLVPLAGTQQTPRTNAVYAVLPLVLDSKYGYPLVFVSVQGIKIPVSFDLGGSKLQLALSPAILKQHHIQVNYTGEVVPGVDARGVKSVSREFILPEAELGDFVANDVRGIEYHAWGGEGAPKNGSLGFDLIAKFNVVIDFRNLKIFLIKGTGYPPGYDIDAWPKVPFTADGRMITDATVNDKVIRLLWDTATPASSIKTTTKISGNVQSCSETILFKLATNSSICKKITTTNFVIGGHDFGSMVFHTRSMPGLPVDGMVGDDFFEDHVVYLDFARRMVAIHKAGS